MKKGIVLALVFLLLLSMTACGSQSKETTPATSEATEVPAEATTEPTVPAPTEPAWEPGVVRAGYGEAAYRIFDIGTQLKVVGKFRSYYVVEQEDVNLLVNTDLLRLESDPVFESWTGYSKSGTEVFDNPYFRGEPIATLNQNTSVTVLESSGNWACIEWAEGTGYVRAEKLSKWRISSGGSSGGGGGGGGGSSDGTDVPIGSLTSAEYSFKPQIHLLGAYYGPETEKPFEAIRATVLANHTEGYICILVRGDTVKVTAWDEETATIWLGDDIYAQVPRWLLKLEGEEAYEAWTGYSRWNGIVYEEHQMRTESFTLSTNKQVTVLDELEDCYVVEYEGRIGYMNPDKVSANRISTGGSGGSGSGGGGGGGGGGGATWTPPAL